MAAIKKRIVIPGSERKPLQGATVVGPVEPAERADVTLRLRPRKGADKIQERTLKMAAKAPKSRKYLSREEFAAKCGADPTDLRQIDDFARAHGLTVGETNLAARTVRLNGTLADLGAAFGTELQVYKAEGQQYRGRTGKLSLPAALEGIVQAVYGLDTRNVAKPHLRKLADAVADNVDFAEPHNAADGSFKTPELAKLYNFPTGLDGKGQCIAIIELNDTDSSGKPTGTGYTMSDLNTYFKGVGLATPSVVSVGVDGGANVPGSDSGADGEVALDIEVAGAIAPAAQIAVYFATNTTAGFINSINAALHDTVRKPSVISISWGSPEDGNPKQYLDGMAQAFQDAATLGVTVCCAAGDNGSADMDQASWDKKPHCDFPSSIPYALACGGTKLQGSGATITSEVVWNEGTKGGATGGGVSDIYTRPSYQANANVPTVGSKKFQGRGVPDVAGVADPYTGYQVYVGGKAQVYGGTSAVAPLWAGLIALFNQRLAAKKITAAGFINPLLYKQPAKAGVTRDITSGNNDIYGSLKGLYKAGTGWDACTGLGSPNGAKLLTALGG